jgi:hypothetical protein
MTYPEGWNRHQITGLEIHDRRVINGKRIDYRYTNARHVKNFSTPLIYEDEAQQFYIAFYGFANADHKMDPIAGPFTSFEAAYTAFRVTGLGT